MSTSLAGEEEKEELEEASAGSDLGELAIPKSPLLGLVCSMAIIFWLDLTLEAKEETLQEGNLGEWIAEVEKGISSGSSAVCLSCVTTLLSKRDESFIRGCTIAGEVIIGE